MSAITPITQLRADLVEVELSEKRINNILAVLSKPLHYAAECNVIGKVPRMGLFKCERPEIEAWDFAEYARLLAAAKTEGEDWAAAVCLAGEAGLRVGEVKALRLREDVDLISRTLTVRQQTCNGVTTTPKGRTRRTVPITTTLYDALKRMSVVREGFVVRNADGSQKSDGEASWWMARICRKAGLPVRYWHTLRHNTESSIIRRSRSRKGPARWRSQASHRQSSALSSEVASPEKQGGPRPSNGGANAPHDRDRRPHAS